MNTSRLTLGKLSYASRLFTPVARTVAGQSAIDIPATAGPRYDTIDLLRGISILGVILLHASLCLSFSGHEVGTTLPKWLQYMIFNEGGNGVSVFFAISGFLITLVSIRRFGSLGDLSIKSFYRIRFARIAPPLLFLLGVLSLLHLYGPPEFRIRANVGSLPRALFATLTFQTNWFEAVHGWLPASWTVLWSLSIEEMFYLLFPLFCVAFMRTRWSRPIFIGLLIFLIGFGPFARTPWYTANDIWAYQSYLGNMDNVALGCIFGLLAHRLSKSSWFVRSRWPLYSQMIGAVLILFIVDWFWPKVILGWHVKHVLGVSGTDVTILGLGTCLVMLGSAVTNGRGSRWTLPLRWLGRYSYEVYLSHELVVIAVITFYSKIHKGPIALWILATILLCGLLGHTISVLFSEPMNRRLRGAPLPSQLTP